MEKGYALIARAAGVVLFVAGIGLALLAMWILERQLTHRGTIDGGVAIFTTIVVVIAAFCLLLAYRLMFNQPNRHGSLLPPTGWRILAALFTLLALAIGSVAIWRGEYRFLLGAFCAGLLSSGCFAASRGVRWSGRWLALSTETPLSPVFPAETSLLQKEGFTPVGFQWGVEILNDDRTPMEFVVSALGQHFGLSREEAIRTMLEIHHKGGVLLATQTADDSKRIADTIAAEARAKGHPLTCRAVSR